MSLIREFAALHAAQTQTDQLDAIEAAAAVFRCLATINNGYIESTLAAAEPPIETLPPARLWRQHPSFNEERRWELACEAIMDAAATSFIAAGILRQPPKHDPFHGATLQESLANSLMEQNHTRPFDIVWASSLAPERATQAVYRLTLQQENLLIFVGVLPRGNEVVTILGEQPFAAPLLPRDREAYPPQEIADVHQDTDWLVEGLDEAHADWWGMLPSGSQTLARASLLQLCTAGCHIDITTPEASPRWIGVEIPRPSTTVVH